MQPLTLSAQFGNRTLAAGSYSNCHVYMFAFETWSNDGNKPFLLQLRKRIWNEGSCWLTGEGGSEGSLSIITKRTSVGHIPKTHASINTHTHKHTHTHTQRDFKKPATTALPRLTEHVELWLVAEKNMWHKTKAGNKKSCIERVPQQLLSREREREREWAQQDLQTWPKQLSVSLSLSITAAVVFLSLSFALSHFTSLFLLNGTKAA